MDIASAIRMTGSLALTLGSELPLAVPLGAQGRAEATVTVRIRPGAGADYDPSSEVLLRGRLVGRDKGLILVRISGGIVRVDVGSWDEGALREAGGPVEILAARHLEEGRQWFLAREIRHAGGRVLIRDDRGVLRPEAGPPRP